MTQKDRFFRIDQENIRRNAMKKKQAWKVMGAVLAGTLVFSDAVPLRASASAGTEKAQYRTKLSPERRTVQRQNGQPFM